MSERTGRIAVTNPRDLTWVEVDPLAHAFDPAAVADVVRSFAAAKTVPERSRRSRETYDAWVPDKAQPWVESISRELVDHYGAWASGWRWGLGESDFDGGPVREWCCAMHSITGREETLARVAAAMVDWRGWLEELAARFDSFLPLPSEDEEAMLAGWERAVASLVTLVVERTESESGWYDHCAQVLVWFLSAAGVPPGKHDRLVQPAIGGDFGSWFEPDPSTIERVAAKVARGIAGEGDA